MSKRLCLVLAGGFLAPLLSGFSAPALAAGAVEGAKVTWNMSLWGKEREVTQSAEGVAAYVKEKTGGAFTIKMHYGEALSEAKENLDGLKLNAFQAAQICGSYHPGKNPSLGVLELPFMFPDLDAAQRAHEAIFAHPYVVQEMARWNAKLLVGGLIPDQKIFGRGKAPLKVEDFKGMRIRALGGLGEAMKMLGAVPTSVPAAETYTAIERGTVQSAVYTIGSAFSFGLADVVEWWTPNLSLGAPTCPVVVNLKSFDALPQQYRALLIEAKKPAYERIKKAWNDGDNKNIPKLKAKGVKEVVYSPQTIAAIQKTGGKPVWDKWIGDNAAKGLPAKELFDLVFKAAQGG